LWRGLFAAVLRLLRNKLFQDILFIFIVGIFCSFRLFINEFPAGHDALSTLFQIETFEPFFMWNDRAYCGYPLSLPIGGFCVEMLLATLLMHLSIDSVTVVKLFMFLEFVGSGLSMYFLSRLFFTSRPARLIPALCYMLSQFTFVHIAYEGHIETSWAYALAPLIFLLFERALRSGKCNDSIITGIFGAVYLGMIHLGCAVMMGFLLLFYFILRLYRPYNNRWRTLSQGLISACVLVLLSAFWLLPYVLLFYSDDIPFRSIETYSYYGSDLLRALTISVSGCCTPQYLGYFGPFSCCFGFWLPILASLGILRKKDGVSIFLSLVAIVSLFFATASRPPLGTLFMWCSAHIPGLAIILGGIGDAEKFLWLVNLAYAFLIGVAVDGIWSFFHRRQSQAVLNKEISKYILGKYLFLTLVLCLILLHSWIPITSGFQSFNLPNDYIRTYEQLSQNIGDERILGLPLSVWAWDWQPPRDVFAPTEIIDPNIFVPSIMGISTLYGSAPHYGLKHTREFIRRLIDLLNYMPWDKNINIGRIVGEANVRYIVVDRKRTQTDQIESLYRQEGLREIISNDHLLVFENDFCKPLIYTDKGTQLSYIKNNPCDYTVHIKNAKQPFMLVFSQSYHPMWRAYVDGQEVEPVLYNSFLNGFPIDKTGDFDVRIHFKGQDYANIGIVISSVSFIAVLIYLIYSSVRSRRKFNLMLGKPIILLLRRKNT